MKMARNIDPNLNAISRISSASTVRGEMYSRNDIRIDGTFEGKIYSEGKVVVGEKAIITGDIICTNVDFWGKLKGNLYVKDTLSLKDGCVVDGELHIRRIMLELGSKFNGTCRMIDEAEFDKLTETLGVSSYQKESQASEKKK